MSRCHRAGVRCVAIALCVMVVSSHGAEASALWASGGGILSLTPINPANGAASSPVAINGLTRTLTDVAGESTSHGSLVWGVSGFFGDGPLVSMDPATKQVVSSVAITPTLTAAIQSLAIDPVSGQFYGASTSALYRIAPATGAATLVGATALAVDKALGFDANGNLYGIANDNRLVAVDKGTGATSLVAVLGVERMEDIAVQPETGVMYGIGYGPDYSLYQIDLTNGTLVKLGASLIRPTGLAFAALPEPASIVIVAAGLFCLSFRRRPTSHNRI
jgi:hypothetical protein